MVGGHRHERYADTHDGTLLVRTGGTGVVEATVNGGYTFREVPNASPDPALFDTYTRVREALGLDEIVARVASPGTLGEPTVLTEKPPNEDNLQQAFGRLEKYLNESVDASIPVECGGVNSPIAYAAAGELELPVIDVDGMNRAFPELQMTTWATHDIAATPLVSVDDHGHACIVDMGDRNRSAETVVRTVAMEYGGISWIASYPMNEKGLKETSVLYSQSLGPRSRPHGVRGTA